jgi:hypothetical protein
MSWLKLDHNIITDIKLRRFSVAEKWAWIVLLCLASQGENRGIVTDDLDDIADLCDTEAQDLQYLLDKFRAKGLISHVSGGIEITHWGKWQDRKPSATTEGEKERKRRQRAAKKERQNKDVPPMSHSCPAIVPPPDQDKDLDLDPEVEEYYAHEETATVDRSEGNRPVSSPSHLPSSENKNSQHPEQPKETIDTAEVPQGNNGSSGHIDSLDKPRASGGNTRSLVYGGNIHKIMTLVGIGQSLGLWATQESLAAFQTALMGELDRLGRKEPARALTAILRGVERRSAPEVEEVRGYWARFDGKKITPIAAESLPWVGSGGQIDAGYTAWVKANAATLDGQLPDGTYKVALILQTKSSNKLAVAAWTAYQKELNYRAMIDAEAIRRQQEWDDRTALLEAERAAKLARADYAKAS